MLRDSLMFLYYTLVHPYLLYCNISWDGAIKHALYRVVCLQKYAMVYSHIPIIELPVHHCFYIYALYFLTFIDVRLVYIYIYKAKNNLLPISSIHHTRIADLNPRFPLRNPYAFELFPFRTK